MSDGSQTRPSENAFSSPENSGVKQVERKEEQKESRDVKEAADVGKAAFVEAVGLDESLETGDKVSEILSSTKEGDKSSSPMGSKVSTGITPAQIKAQLLKNLPSEKEMRHQIDREIRKEVAYLHKKAMKMFRSPGNMSYFEMNNLMKKIRELKGILMALLRASFDSLKTLWLRYVHGIM